jgi:hypothetical protein
MSLSDLKKYEGQDANTIAVNNYLDKCILMKECLSDPHILLGPPKIIQAQDVDASHVAELVTSFLGTGTISKHGIGVVIDTDLYHRWKDNNEQISQEECEEAGVCMISGNHTREGAVHINDKFPNNPTFQQVTYVLCVMPDTSETRDMLRIHGLLANFKNKIVRRQDWWNAAQMMHNQLAKEIEYWPEGEVPSNNLARMKGQWVLGTKNAMNTIGAWYQVAKRTGSLWEKIVKCVTGVGVANENKFLKWSSASHWVPMSAMPTNIIEEYLQEAILGFLTYTQFRKKCQMYKCRQRFQKRVAEHVESLLNVDNDDGMDECDDIDDPTLYNEARWSWIKENLAVLTEEVFVNTYVKMRYQSPVKEDFPESLYDDCKKVYEARKKHLSGELSADEVRTALFCVS